LLSAKQKGLIEKLAKEKKFDLAGTLATVFGKSAVAELTSKEASALIKQLMESK
jgi:hypothetical protein